MKKIFLAIAIFAAMASPALAVNTTVAYTSPLLVLLFVGFCALLVVMQLIPAVLVLFGATKAAMKETKKAELAKNKI